jgi:hypothetical protein
MTDSFHHEVQREVARDQGDVRCESVCESYNVIEKSDHTNVNIYQRP